MIVKYYISFKCFKNMYFNSDCLKVKLCIITQSKQGVSWLFFFFCLQSQVHKVELILLLKSQCIMNIGLSNGCVLILFTYAFSSLSPISIFLLFLYGSYSDIFIINFLFCVHSCKLCLVSYSQAFILANDISFSFFPNLILC